MQQRDTSQTLARRVDYSLPWAAGIATLAGILTTALADVPNRLPGIALNSTLLFHAERGVAAIAVLIVGITVVTRTLKRELPIGFSATTGSVTYAETVANATASFEASATRFNARLTKHEIKLSDLTETVDALVDSIAAIDAIDWSKSLKSSQKMS